MSAKPTNPPSRGFNPSATSPAVTLSSTQVEELFIRLDNVVASNKALVVAIKGDESLGHKGIVKRLAEYEAALDNNSKALKAVRVEMRTAGGIIIGAFAILNFFKESIFGN